MAARGEFENSDEAKLEELLSLQRFFDSRIIQPTVGIVLQRQPVRFSSIERRYSLIFQT